MTDFFSPALDAIYDTLGVEATFDGITEPIVVLDKTAGVEVQPSGPGRMPTLVPALCIRAASVGGTLEGVAALVGMTVTMNSASWVVANHKPRPTPQGEAKGEYYVFLRKVLS